MRIGMSEAEAKEQRLIAIARIRAGMSIRELAALMFVTPQALYYWEHGKNRAPWEELYRFLPELKSIRENGCSESCVNRKACLGGGRCHYASRKALWEARESR